MLSRLRQVILAIGYVGIAFSSVVSGQTQKVDGNFYREFIRPILSDKCFTCHGPDEQTREGGFRFDQRESAFGEADSGEHPIVAGSIEESELLKRIFAELDDWSRMPPVSQQKQLSDDDKAHLKRWIEGGAPWQGHWAFEPVTVPAVPNVAASIKDFGLARTWQVNPIDAFVLAEIDNQNLKPSPRASKATLIRRLSFDLTGLPPTPAEVDAFLQDNSENAYETVVDRLLDSPHYGEHMSSSWLDAARFADTNGYQNDFRRNMWPWRDWVIDAYNNNMPFDQFTIEQLAGDMLPDATLSQKIATGFNRNNRTVTEGGSIEQEWHVENVIDRVETVATTFLGLTMGCARCHDHKYDPVSQKEFYEFYAYFNSTKDKGFYNEKRGNVGPTVRVPSQEDSLKRGQLRDRVAGLEKKLADLVKQRPLKQKAWETEFVSSELQVDHLDDFKFGMLAFVESNSNHPAAISQQMKDEPIQSRLIDSPFSEDKKTFPAVTCTAEEGKHLSIENEFKFDGSKPFSVSIWIKPEKYGAIASRMDAGNDYRGFDVVITDRGQVNIHLIHKWPVNAIKITTIAEVPKNQWSHIAVAYDGSQKAKGLTVFINDKIAKHDVNNDNLAGTTLTDHPFWIGRRTHTSLYAGAVTDFRVYDRKLGSTDISALFRKPLRDVALIDQEQRTAQQSDLLSNVFGARFSRDESQTRRKLSEARRELKQFESSIPTTMVMAELESPRKTYLLNRGLYDQADETEELQPGIPSFLPQPKPEHSPNRLGLAKWIVAPDNPLTARVTVNRFWQNYFGAGLLGTPENFGVQSPLPSHPDLLDWLAAEFVRTGWDVKAFQKQIVMSETYRQSSRVTQETLTADPKNRFLARGPRFRLSSEAIRDNALAVSGLLTRKIGGPSIKPYQPEGLWQELAGGAGEKPYVQATDENLYRRSLYIYRKRTVPHPAMSTFDSGSREICLVARQRTNTPLQALALLNDVTYVEAARALATKMLMQNDNLESQVKAAFQRCMARAPTKEEHDVLIEAFHRYVDRFAKDEDAATQLIGFGELNQPDSVDDIQLAAMTLVCSTILNLDEAITKE